MREVTYRLSNGTIVETLREAKMSGLWYETLVTNVPTPEEKYKPTPKRAEILAQFGVVRPMDNPPEKQKVIL